MNKPMKPASRAALLSILLALAASARAFAGPGFEPVQSAPVETELAEPGLRTAAEVWPEMIDRALKTLDIEQFYFTPKDGEPLDAVLAAVRKAGERGVRVRVLAEKKFEKVSTEGLKFLRTVPNLELRVIDWSKIKDDGIVHAKFFVVDGKEAYFGSQNFDWRSLKHIHEMGLRTTEPGIVSGLAAIFAHDWKAQSLVEAGETAKPLNTAPPKAATDKPAYLVASPWEFNPPGVGDSEGELVRLIGAAGKTVSVELLDYAPLDRKGAFYPPIDNALRAAAARGVKVRLMVSHWNTKKPYVDHLKSLSLVPGIEVRIVTVPPAKEGYIPFARVIHSKFMVTDGETLWLGTSNWSGGYLTNSRNVEAVVKDAELSAKLASVHERLWTSAHAAALDPAKDYPEPKR